MGEDCQLVDGWIILDDLNFYQPTISHPLCRKIIGHTIHGAGMLVLKNQCGFV
jgi:gamma-glutamyltranspeptidase